MNNVNIVRCYNKLNQKRIVRKMIKSFEISIITLIRACIIVAAIPIIVSMITSKGEKLDTLFGQIAFWGIDCLPLYYLWNNIYRNKKFSSDIKSKSAGVTMALVFFLVIHLTFYIAVWLAIKSRVSGTSTAGIVFFILPLLSIIVMIIGYYIGFFVYSINKGRLGK